MERKDFKSVLFSRKIKADDLDYWFYLYADLLYRLKKLKDLNCPCTFCWKDKVHYEQLLDLIITDGHIKKHPFPPAVTNHLVTEDSITNIMIKLLLLPFSI
jgi:hypothetical protein